MKHPIRTAVPAFVALAALAGCDDSTTDPDDGNQEPGAATMSVYLTDAPGDVEAVWVEVLEIYLQGDNGEDGGRTVLLEEPTDLIELTSLAGTSEPLVQDEELEPGNYGQLRFVIGEAVLETTEGQVYSKDGAEHPDGLETTGNLICPSCSQSGIKVVLGDTEVVLEEGENEFLLDFDVTQTFGRQAGQSGNWVMHPVIHGVDLIEMGSIVGTVALEEDTEGEPLVTIPECPVGTARDLADFVPTATAVTLTGDEGEEIIRTGMTTETGEFQVLALAPDEYDLGYLATIPFDEDELVWTAEVDPLSVEVAEGDEASGVAYTVTGASCEPLEEEEEETDA